MKKQTLALVIISLLLLAAPFGARSQADRSTDGNYTLVLVSPTTKETLYSFTSGVEKIVITPSGNFLRTLTFSIEPDNPIMAFSTPVRIIEVKMFYDVDGDGIEEVIVDTMAVLTRSGNLKLVFHSNGAGNSLPPGWDF